LTGRRGPLGRVVATAAVLLAALAAPGSAPGGAEVKGPPDFQVPRSETSPGEVTFSHAAHRTKVDKCSTCHMRDLKMKRGGSGPITLAAKQEGRFCGACHDGKTTIGGTVVFPIDECDRCHK
jgi:c(7)-type cytochrome triheme protein